ncbi:MAG: hypothetical protein M3Q77_09935 [Thermoproteota archaeon]|nr:hypothetical protein [Thermoproteota archaeon]
MSERIEKAKQIAIEFYEKQQELMNLLASLNDEEQKYFIHGIYLIIPLVTRINKF